jgi:DNA-binding NarL/FixJ family response regulator
MNIFLLFDSMIVRNWVADLILKSPSIRIIGKARTAFAALGDIERLQPDVLILHSQDQKRFGVNILQCVKNVSPATKVIAITSKHAVFHGHETVNHGADIFLTRFSDWKKIPDIVGTICAKTACCHQTGERYLQECTNMRSTKQVRAAAPDTL